MINKIVWLPFGFQTVFYFINRIIVWFKGKW
jgi:hypothetical protein